MGTNHKLKQWLLDEMVRREITQADLARLANLNRAVINKLLNGQSNPRPATLESIARAFKIPVESVYRRAGLLPDIPDVDSYIDEITHVARQIQSPQRRSTILLFIRALADEEKQENNRK